MVLRSTQVLIRAGSLDMLHLLSHRSDMASLSRGLFLSRGTNVDAAVSAVVANTGRVVVDDRRVVDVPDFGDIYVVDSTVVVKVIMVPAPAFIAVAKVSEAVVDSTIEAYNGSPIALVEDEAATVPSPVAWGPEKSDLWREHPSAGHPEVVAVSVVPSPITWRPDVTVSRA